MLIQEGCCQLQGKVITTNCTKYWLTVWSSLPRKKCGLVNSVILFWILGCYLFLHIGKYFIKIGKISDKIHEIGKTKAIFGLGMTPI